jgi:hypothetical protein
MIIRGVQLHDRRSRLKSLLGGMVVALLGLSGTWADEPSAGAEPNDSVVQMVVDFGDGVQKHFTQLKWQEGATVFDVMQAAMRHPRGIRVKYRGKRETLLVTEIDGLQSEAAGAGSRNWIFRINGQLGQRSAGISPLKAGDTVLWRFETYR